MRSLLSLLHRTCVAAKSARFIAILFATQFICASGWASLIIATGYRVGPSRTTKLQRALWIGAIFRKKIMLFNGLTKQLDGLVAL